MNRKQRRAGLTQTTSVIRTAAQQFADAMRTQRQNKLDDAVRAFAVRFIFAAVGALAFTVASANAQPAHIEYPWCAVYSGGMGGASNCGFTTIEQCRATVSGIGGSCEPNSFYHPPQAGPRTSSKRKHRKTDGAH